MNIDHADRAVRMAGLFLDPRRYRGDCRAFRGMIRKRWLDKCPDADAVALVSRFNAAGAADRATQRSRASRDVFAEVETMLAISNAALRCRIAAQRRPTGKKRIGAKTGRPRRRRYVPQEGSIDVNALRRQAKAEGIDLRTAPSISVRVISEPGAVAELVEFATRPDEVCGCRQWLVCPRCQTRRVHLYVTGHGVRCRKCAGMVYGGK